MRIGILTFPNSTSYGATLQMYALYHTVKKLGHDVEVINYHNAYMKAGKHTRRGPGNGVRDLLRFGARTVLHGRLERGFRDFERRNIELFPQKAIVTKEGLRFADERYDAVICGSDQVWNPDITDSDLSYFLDFCSDGTRRISYAPSFGVERLSEELIASAARELNRFSAISVREVSGQALVEQMIGKSVPIVIDPTILIGRKEWEKLEDADAVRKDDYVLYYTVRSSERLFNKCREFSKNNGLRMVVVGGNFIRRMKNREPYLEYATDVSPQEWLSLVHHARYVVTNSFHGTAFSIIFRKSFYLDLSAATNSRLTNIVDMLGLSDRIVPADEPITPSDADYSTAEERLPKICFSSLDYLKNTLEN